MTRMTTFELSIFRSAGPLAFSLLARDLLQNEARVYEPVRSKGPVARLASSLARRWERNRAISQLNRLDDRMLRDIGIERGSLEEAVDAVIERRTPAWTEPSLVSQLTGFAAKLVAPIANWHAERRTLAQLEALDRHLLQDIGIERGDLVVARSQVMKQIRAANTNGAPEKHAA